MTDDAPQVTMWEWHPVTTDSGDMLLTPNDITVDQGATTTTGVMAAIPTSKKSKSTYFYNYPAFDFSKTGCLFTQPA